MPVHLVALVFSLTFWLSVSGTDVMTTSGDTYKVEGFQCGNIFFRKEYIKSVVTEQALPVFLNDASTLFEGTPSKYPEAYSGSLGLEEEDKYLMWPLLHPNPMGSNEETLHKYFLAIGSRSWEALGVTTIQPLEQNPKKLYMRCDGGYEQLEIPLSSPEISQPFFETGFRCPVELFSRDVVEVALQHFRNLRAMLGKDRVTELYGYPRPFRGKVFLQIKHALYKWPINTKGFLDTEAPTFLVLDSYDNPVAMIEENMSRIGRLIKCKSTLFNEIIPRFIDLDPLQKENIMGTQMVDIFQCGIGYFRTELLLIDAAKAVDGFIANRIKKMKYPHLIPDNHDERYKRLYTWPSMATRKGEYPRNFRSVRLENTAFIKITDFCDIVGVIYFGRDGDEKSCVRKYIPKYLIEQYGEGYL